MNNTKKNIIIIALALLSVLLFYMLISTKKSTIEYVPVHIYDTITVEKERILEKTKTKYITQFDTVIIKKTDTVLLQLPIEHLTYSDTLSTDTSRIILNIDYSGFKASLDEININYQSRHLAPVSTKKTSLRKFVGVGIYAGTGVGYNPFNSTLNFGAPEIGVCVTFGYGLTW